MPKDEKINTYIVMTVTAKVANHNTGQSKDDCTSSAFTRSSERAKQRGTSDYIDR